MNLDAAFATYLDEGTMAPSQSPRVPQIQIIAESIASSETPLPLGSSIVRDLPTQAPVVQRSIKAHVKTVEHQLRTAGILKVSEQAEAMVSELMTENLPKPTTRRILTPRAK